MARINVSSGGWSKPSPTSRPVASRIRGESGGSSSISAIRFARCFFDMRPCSTKGVSFVFFQRAPDIFEMIGALCQHQYLATVVDGTLRFIGNRGCSILVFSQGSEYVLNPGVVWYWCWPGKGSRNDLEIMRRAGRLCRRMSDWPTLHEDDRLLAVSADRGCGEPEDVACFDGFEDGVERDCADMMVLMRAVHGAPPAGALACVQFRSRRNCRPR